MLRLAVLEKSRLDIFNCTEVVSKEGEHCHTHLYSDSSAIPRCRAAPKPSSKARCTAMMKTPENRDSGRRCVADRSTRPPADFFCLLLLPLQIGAQLLSTGTQATIATASCPARAGLCLGLTPASPSGTRSEKVASQLPRRASRVAQSDREHRTSRTTPSNYPWHFP